MKNLSNIIPGYNISEYQLVIYPHEELRRRILKIKKEFNETYKSAVALYSPPQLLLTSFIQYDMMEEKLLNRLNMIAMGFHPVKIELKDFGSFPSHTIYVNVTSRLPIQYLVKQIRSEAQALMRLNEEHKPHFIMEPHITIARKLAPWQYEKGWLEFSHRHFTGRFIADSMLLLKRQTGTLQYQVVKRFEFQNLLVGTTQGSLFC